MMSKEAKWIGRVLYGEYDDRFFPLLNIGSSSEHYRRHIQPWIDRYIFASARERGLEVVHTDMIDAPGVDVVGDLLDASFLEQLRSTRFRGVLCSNLLEHVPNRQKICDVLRDIIQPSGYLIVTVPNQYFLHPDPIDTNFRPTAYELTALFPEMETVEAEVLSCGTHAKRMLKDPRNLLLTSLRLAAPFYRPRGWLPMLKLNLAWALRDLRVTCAVLRKPEGAEDSGTHGTKTATK